MGMPRRRRLKHPATMKVLERMNPPKAMGPDSVRPLLIFWAALESRQSPNAPLFRVEVDSPKFIELLGLLGVRVPAEPPVQGSGVH